MKDSVKNLHLINSRYFIEPQETPLLNDIYLYNIIVGSRNSISVFIN